MQHTKLRSLYSAMYYAYICSSPTHRVERLLATHIVEIVVVVEQLLFVSIHQACEPPGRTSANTPKHRIENTFEPKIAMLHVAVVVCRRE